MEYLTKEKLAELKSELNELKTKRRKEIAENLEYAKSLGDLSENAEYLQAREDQANVEARIAKIEDIISDVKIIEKHHSAVVEVGTTVTVKKKGESKTITYTVVSSEESDITQNKISIRSPLGEALSGKKKGEVATFKTPKGAIEYTVVEIE